jgi:thioredoxin 1
MSSTHLTDGNFKKEVLESDLPALVDFWAPWCGPCRTIAPLIDELAKEYRNKLRVCKINVDENPRIATQYAVMSIPTLIFFKNGKVIEQVVRVLNKAELKRKIEENLE